MTMNNCPQCGAPTDGVQSNCKFCGEKLAVAPTQAPVAPAAPVAPPVTPQPQHTQQAMNQNAYYLDPGVNPAWPMKSKTAAGLLGVFFGGLGIHKFYMGRIGWGIVYLLFCWTYIPAIIGFIEGLIYLIQNEHNFQVKNKVRTR